MVACHALVTFSIGSALYSNNLFATFVQTGEPEVCG